MPRFFDSHCHFDFEPFAGHQQALWQQCRDQGIEQLCIPGVSPRQSARSLQAFSAYPGIVCAAGLHPWWIDRYRGTPERLVDELRPLAQNPRCVAIGECGLDATIATAEETQQAYFDVQIELARALEKPLVIHSLRKNAAVYQSLKQHRPPQGGVIHGFSGSPEEARQFWQLGFYIGVGGTITYPRARKTRRAVSQLPLEALVLETDAPDMPLCGRQGQSNSPLYLTEVARCLAQLRSEPLATLAQQTTLNARRLFQL